MYLALSAVPRMSASPSLLLFSVCAQSCSCHGIFLTSSFSTSAFVFARQYLLVVGELMGEDVTMLCGCHGGLCAARALGLSGVAGCGSTVPDLPSSSSVSVWCRPSLILVLVLVLVPSTCSLVSSVLWCLRRPLEFGRRL
jgi:hypothetical protein